MNHLPDIATTQRLLGAEIRTLRQARRISFLQLCARAGVSKANLSKIENGKGNPTIETIVRLTRALRCSFSAVLTERPHSNV